MGKSGPDEIEEVLIREIATILVETELRREDFQTIRSMATCIGKLI